MVRKMIKRIERQLIVARQRHDRAAELMLLARLGTLEMAYDLGSE